MDLSGCPELKFDAPPLKVDELEIWRVSVSESPPPAPWGRVRAVIRIRKGKSSSGGGGGTGDGFAWIRSRWLRSYGLVRESLAKSDDEAMVVVPPLQYSRECAAKWFQDENPPSAFSLSDEKTPSSSPPTIPERPARTAVSSGRKTAVQKEEIVTVSSAASFRWPMAAVGEAQFAEHVGAPRAGTSAYFFTTAQLVSVVNLFRRLARAGVAQLQLAGPKNIFFDDQGKFASFVFDARRAVFKADLEKKLDRKAVPTVEQKGLGRCASANWADVQYFDLLGLEMALLTTPTFVARASAPDDTRLFQGFRTPLIGLGARLSCAPFLFDMQKAARQTPAARQLLQSVCLLSRSRRPSASDIEKGVAVGRTVAMPVCADVSTLFAETQDLYVVDAVHGWAARVSSQVESKKYALEYLTTEKQFAPAADLKTTDGTRPIVLDEIVAAVKRDVGPRDRVWILAPPDAKTSAPAVGEWLSRFAPVGEYAQVVSWAPGLAMAAALALASPAGDSALVESWPPDKLRQSLLVFVGENKTYVTHVDVVIDRLYVVWETTWNFGLGPDDGGDGAEGSESSRRAAYGQLVEHLGRLFRTDAFKTVPADFEPPRVIYARPGGGAGSARCVARQRSGGAQKKEKPLKVIEQVLVFVPNAAAQAALEKEVKTIQLSAAVKPIVAQKLEAVFSPAKQRVVPGSATPVQIPEVLEVKTQPLGILEKRQLDVVASVYRKAPFNGWIELLLNIREQRIKHLCSLSYMLQ